MGIRRLYFARFIVGFMLTILAVWVGVYVRITSTLPLLDRMRFAHWRSHETWTTLADMMSSQSIIDSIQVWPGDNGLGEVTAWDYSGKQVTLSPDDQSRYEELLAAAGPFLHLDKNERGIFHHLGVEERFGRSFSVWLVSPTDAYGPFEECNRQYRQVDQGSCVVPLGPNWVLGYGWNLPVDQVPVLP